jgi:hypothetical protein
LQGDKDLLERMVFVGNRETPTHQDARRNGCATYMREYRKRKRLEEDNCNNVPEWTKLHAERQREYRETHKNLSAECMNNCRKDKAQESKTPQAPTPWWNKTMIFKFTMKSQRIACTLFLSYNISVWLQPVATVMERIGIHVQKKACSL